MNYKKILFLMLFAVLFVSCDKDDNGDSLSDRLVLSDIDGLWVEESTLGAFVLNHMEISGEKVVWCKAAPVTYNYSERQNGTVSYDNKKGTGSLSVDGGSNFSFFFDQGGNMVADDGHIYFRLDNTLDGLAASAPLAMPHNVDGLPGPEHDLGVDLSFDGGLLQNEDGLSSVYLDILAFIGENMAKGAISAIGSKSMGYFVDKYFQSSESKQLSTLIDKTEEINNRLQQILIAIENRAYEDKMNERMLMLSKMYNYSDVYINLLNECDTTDVEGMNKIVTEWATRAPIDGDAPDVKVSVLLDFIMKTVVEGHNLYEMYDAYVFNTVPWESMGYEFREALRANDAAMVASHASLTFAYIKTRTDWPESERTRQMEKLSTTLEAFADFGKANAVVHHDDKAICQIFNAHFITSRNVDNRYYRSLSWFPSGTTWDGNNSLNRIIYGGTSEAPDVYRYRQISYDYMNTLYCYYNESQSSNKYTSWGPILRNDAKFNLPSNDDKNILLLNGGYYYEREKAGLIFDIWASALPLQDLGVGFLFPPSYGLIGIAEIWASGVGQYQVFHAWDADRMQDKWASWYATKDFTTYN